MRDLANVKIRGYHEKDKEACRRLWEELTTWHRDIYGDPSIGGPEPGFHFDEHLAKAGSNHLLVAVVDGKVVGLAGYLVEDKEVEVEPLVVSTAYRGRGVGSMLLETVVKRVTRMGVSFLTVRPVARNRRAIEFFRERGFDKVGHVELFIDCSGGRWKRGLKLFDQEFGY